MDILVDVLAAIAPKPVVTVRDEHPQTFEHILELRASSRRQVGLVVIGHPGVDMHMSRFWYTHHLVHECLQARHSSYTTPLVQPLPLASLSPYVTGRISVFFHENRVHMITAFNVCDFPHRTLFLVDSNSSLYSPPGAFLDPNFSGVIVQATGPEISRWSSWSKEASASFSMSAPQEREEILALQ